LPGQGFRKKKQDETKKPHPCKFGWDYLNAPARPCPGEFPLSKKRNEFEAIKIHKTKNRFIFGCSKHYSSITKAQGIGLCSEFFRIGEATNPQGQGS